MIPEMRHSLILATGLAAALGAITSCSPATARPCYSAQDIHVRPCPSHRPPTAVPTTSPTTSVPTTAPTTVPTTPATTGPTTTAPTETPTTTPTEEPISPLGPTSPTGAWQTVMADDFSTLDLDTWVVQDGRDMNGVYSRTANATVTGGHLRLQLSEESGTTYGAVVSSNTDWDPEASRYTMLPGDVVEARIFFPGSATSEVVNWGGFWTSGSDWPQGGENDVFEGGPDVSINYHGVNSWSGGDLNHLASNFVPDGDWGGRWVTATLYRRTDGVSEVYYDGQLVRTVSTADHERPDAAQTVLFSLGVSDQEKVTGDAGALLVDWFRAYRPA